MMKMPDRNRLLLLQSAGKGPIFASPLSFFSVDERALGSPRGGTNSDRVQRTKQGAVSGCAVEALPAAEIAETEQGQPSKFTSGRRPAQ